MASASIEATSWGSFESGCVVYNKPWTIAFPIWREKFELREAACHEEDHDLPHLKALKDAAAAKK